MTERLIFPFCVSVTWCSDSHDCHWLFQVQEEGLCSENLYEDERLAVGYGANDDLGIFGNLRYVVPVDHYCHSLTP